MKRFFRIAASLVIATIMLSSCFKDSFVMYNYSAMGSLKGGVFTSDDGDIFEIIQNETSVDITKDQPRVFVVMDIVARVEGTTNRYTSNLKGWEIPIMKNSVTRSEDNGLYLRDPISIYQAWVGGGYVNAMIIYPFKKDSKVEHEVNLIVEGESAAKDTLYLSLSHNANGEKYDKDKKEVSFNLGSAYASFTVKEMNENKYKYLCFEWDWYETDSYGNPYPDYEKHYKQTLTLNQK